MGRHQLHHLTWAHVLPFLFRPWRVGVPEPPILRKFTPRNTVLRATALQQRVPPTTWRTAVAARRTSSAAVSASSWFKAKCSTTGVSPGATPTCGRCSCAASVDSRPGSVDRRPTGAVVDTMRPLRSELCAANTVGACVLANTMSANRVQQRVEEMTAGSRGRPWRRISHKPHATWPKLGVQHGAWVLGAGSVV